MRKAGPIAMSAAVAIALASCQSASGPGPGSPGPQAVADASTSGPNAAPPGPFTVDQATRGEATFRDACLRCHETARFSTPDFFRTWTRAPLSQLYGFIAANMPRGAAGSLSRPEYAEVVAYLLALNGIQAGPTELPSSTAALARIRVVTPGP